MLITPKIVPNRANIKENNIGYNGSEPKKGTITNNEHIAAKYLNILLPPIYWKEIKKR